MIYKLAERIAKHLYMGRDASDEEVELTAYGLFAVLSKLLYGCICLMTGLLLSCFFESLCFYAAFLFVKKYSGGIHASTECRCFIASSLSVICAVSFLYFCIKYPIVGYASACLSVMSGVLIMIFSPVPAKEKPLTEAQSKKYGIFACVCVAVLVLIGTALYCWAKTNYLFAVCCALNLDGIVLVSGKVSEKRRANRCII